MTVFNIVFNSVNNSVRMLKSSFPERLDTELSGALLGVGQTASVTSGEGGTEGEYAR